MTLPASASKAPDGSLFAKTRTLMLRLSLSRWIMILVMVSVAGYGVFGNVCRNPSGLWHRTFAKK